jgi:hypothetical protein
MLTKAIVSESGFTCIPQEQPQFYSVYKRWINDILIEVTIDDEVNSSYVELCIDDKYRKINNVNCHTSLHRFIKFIENYF